MQTHPKGATHPKTQPQAHPEAKTDDKDKNR
jgi:hypothetical protein